MGLLDEVDGVVTSILSYPKSRGTFARALQREFVTKEQHNEILKDFEEDWPRAIIVDMTTTVYCRAGDLMVPHPKLRTLDALHLSSALEAQRSYELRFLTFDRDLQMVAKAMLGASMVIK